VLYDKRDLDVALGQCMEEANRVGDAIRSGEWWPQRTGCRYIRIPRWERQDDEEADDV